MLFNKLSLCFGIKHNKLYSFVLPIPFFNRKILFYSIFFVNSLKSLLIYNITQIIYLYSNTIVNNYFNFVYDNNPKTHILYIHVITERDKHRVRIQSYAHFHKQMAIELAKNI